MLCADFPLENWPQYLMMKFCYVLPTLVPYLSLMGHWMKCLLNKLADSDESEVWFCYFGFLVWTEVLIFTVTLSLMKMRDLGWAWSLNNLIKKESSISAWFCHYMLGIFAPAWTLQRCFWNNGLQHANIIVKANPKISSDGKDFDHFQNQSCPYGYFPGRFLTLDAINGNSHFGMTFVHSLTFVSLVLSPVMSDQRGQAWGLQRGHVLM